MQVYVSSTFTDLKTFRAAALGAIRRLGHQTIGMEDYTADSRLPVDKCLNDVSLSDLYVLILGWRYGFVPEQHQKSITELEYRHAVQTGRPVLAFVVDEDMPWPPKLIDRGQPGEAITALRAEVLDAHLAAFFRTPEDLDAKLTSALALHADARAEQERRRLALRMESPTGTVVAGLPFADIGATFRDRQPEQTKVETLIDDARAMMICLVGRAGIGKTALLARICRRLERGEVAAPSTGHRRVRAVIYVSARGGEASLDQLFDYAVSALGSDADDRLRHFLRDMDHPIAAKAEALFSRMRSGMFIIAIDQLDDLFSPEDVIADARWRDFLDVLLQSSHGVRLLATSRRRMVVAPSAMRGVKFVPIDDGLPEDDGIEVLRELDEDGKLRLKNAPPDELRWGVQRVHGVPRALGAIASILANDETLTFHRLVSDNLLFEGEILDNLVAEQYRRLTAEHRMVIEAMSVFGQAVPDIAIRYVLAAFYPEFDVRRALAVLARAMTVRYDRERDAYDLHPLDQAYAYARIPVTGDLYTRENLHRRAANYFELVPIPKHASDVSDIEPLLKARQHYFRIGEFNRAGELASASTRVLLRCGHYGTVEQILDETVDTARGAALGAAHLGKASIDGLRNDWSAAIQHNRKAIELLQPLSEERDRRLLGIAISNLAFAYCRLPDFARADEACRKGLNLAAELSDEWLEGKIAGLMALAALLTGNYQYVFELTARCLELHEKHPLAEAGTSPAHALDILGMAHIARGEYDKALARFDQSLSLRRTLKSKFGLGHSYHNVALAYDGLGDLDRAMRELERSLTIREEIRHIEGLSETLCTMAMVHQKKGHPEQALDCAMQGIAFAAERNGGAVSVVRARFTLGVVFHECRNLPEGLKELEDAREAAQRIGLAPELARISYHLALLRRDAGDLQEALALADVAAERAARAYPAIEMGCRQLAESLRRRLPSA